WARRRVDHQSRGQVPDDADRHEEARPGSRAGGARRHAEGRTGENLQAWETRPQGGGRVDRGASQALRSPLRGIGRNHQRNETGGKQMNQQVNSAAGAQNRTSVERTGDRELVVTRTFTAPPSTVYRAWSQPELFQRWWMPKSLSGVSLVSCEL